MNDKLNFNTLFMDVMPILNKQRVEKEERRKRGEDFNIFRTMRMQNDEVHTHSAVIAALLNPEEYHGSKSSFLRAFLHQINELKIYEDKISDTDNAVIEVEKNIGKISKDKEKGGRLDILIKLNLQDEPLPVLIIIENKIYAADEEKQLVRYCNYAKEDKHCSKYYIFYLTLDGRLPSECSTGKKLKCDEDYYCISYRNDIHNWLSDCQKEAHGKPLIHGIITQYKDLVETLTNQNIDMETRNELVSKIAENHEYMILASMIKDNYKHILNQMCEKKLEPIFNEVATKLGLEYGRYDIWGNQYSGAYFKKEKWKTLSIGLEFMKDNLDNFCYGIKYQNEKGENNQKALDLINKDNELREGDNSNWWAWYIQDKEYPNWMREDAVNALYNGQMKEHIESILREYMGKINSIEDELLPRT